MENPLNTTPLLKEYFDLQLKYEKQFGEKTVLFYEVGSFHEIYQIDNPPIGKAKELSDILNIQITRKNKNKDSDQKNPWMIGFPSHSTMKFISKLINEKYTIIKYDQRDSTASQEKERF